MTPEATFRTWWLEPRDPLVLGDGGRGAALQPSVFSRLPPQATVAGLVRTTILEQGGEITPEKAESALGVRIRGPWLARRSETDTEPWLPIPADVTLAGDDLKRAALLQPGIDEGTLWPEELKRSLDLLTLPAKDKKSRKTRRPEFPFWPLSAILDWGLGKTPEGHALTQPPHPIEPESRVHVAIQSDTQTAVPEALFSSAGLRFAEGFHLAVEVEAPGEPPPASLRFLGGEARTVRCTAEKSAVLPAYEAVSARFEQRAREIEAEGHVLGLRVQLVSPGWFGGWQPAWPPELASHLRAVAMDRFVATSGWNLQQARQRAVKRLVPAGAVFLFGPFPEPARVLALCRELWGRPLPSRTSGDHDPFQASPENDGYGIALAFPYELSKEVP